MAYKSKFMQEMEQQGKLSAASGTSKYKSKFFQEGNHLEKEVAPAPMRTPTDRTFTGVKTTPAALKPMAERPTEQQNQISGEIAARTAGAGSRDPIGTAAHMTKISGLQVQEAELKLNQSKAKLDAARQKEMALTEQSKKLASAQQGLRQLMTQYEMSGDDVTGQAYLLAAEEYNKLLEQYQKDYAAYEKDASVYDEYNSNLLKYQKAYAGYEKNMQAYNTERSEYLQEHPEIALQDASDREIQRTLDRLESEKSGLILTGKAVDWDAVENVNRKIDAVKQLQQQKRLSADNGAWNSGLTAFLDRAEAAIQAGQMEWFAGVAAVDQKLSNAFLKIAGSQIASMGMSMRNADMEAYGKTLMENGNRESKDAAEAMKASRDYMAEALTGAGKIDGWIIEKMQSVGSMMMDMMAAGSTYAMGIPAGADAGKIMAIRAGGSGMLQAQQEGKSETEQLLIGIATGALEYASERMFGGNPIYDAESGWVTDAVAKVIKNPKILKLMYSDGFGIFSEGLEESFVSFMEPVAEGLITLEKPDMATAAELADAFAGGVFLSLVGQGSSVVVREVSGAGRAERKAGRVIQRSDAVQELVSEGLAAKPNTEAFKLATELQEKLSAGKELSAAEIGRQLFANQDAIDAGLLVDDEMKPDSEAPDGALQDPESGYYAIQTAEADGKQTYQLVEVREDGSIRKIGQPVDDLMAAKRATQAQGLNVRHIGKEDVLRDSAQSTMDQVNAADIESTVTVNAADNENTGLRWAGNEEGAYDYGTQQRNVGTGADQERIGGNETGRPAEGQNGGWAGDTVRRAEEARRIRAYAENAGLERRSLKELGFTQGSDGKNLRVLNRSAGQDVAEAFDMAQSAGLRLVPVSGNMYVQMGEDESRVNGIIENGVIYAQADSAAMSIKEVVSHEIFHDRVKRDPGLVRRLVRYMFDNYSQQEISRQFRKYYDDYQEIYSGTASDADLNELIWEEFLADAYAEYSRYGDVALEGLSEEVQEQAWVSEEGADKNNKKARFSFAGRNAETADQEQKRRAEEMEKQGLTAAEIYEETGWYRGKDGKWRFELDDSQMEYSRRGDLEFRKEHPSYGRYRDLLAKADDYMVGKSNEWLTMEEQAELTELQRVWTGTFKKDGQVGEDSRPKTKLTDYIKHDALFEAYPELRNTSLVFEGMERGDRGRYNRSSDTIFVNENLRHTPEDVLIHELQHAIQQIEGFAGGSSVEYWDMRKREGLDIRENDRRIAEADREYQRLFRSAPEELRDKIRAINRAKLRDDWDTVLEIEDQIYGTEHEDLYVRLGDADFDRRMERGDEITSADLYWNTAGEIEARNAAERRKLTKDQRRDMFPELGDENTVFTDSRYSGWAYSKDYDGESASIKQQIENSLELLNQMGVVASVTVPENLQKKDAAVKWATEILKPTGYRVDRQGYGEIYFAKEDLDQGMRYADTPEEKAAVVLLPKVLKRGVEIGSHGNHKNREKQTFTIAAPVEMNGQRGNMAVVVNRHGSRYYAHRIVLPDGTEFRFADKNINAAQELSRGVTENGSLAETTSAASDGIINRTNETVNARFSRAEKEEERDSSYKVLTPQQKEYFKNSKIRDPYGRLKRMYHGTSTAGFTVFDIQGSNFGLFGQGAYFTDDPSVAESYQKKGVGEKPGTYEVYLNISNPLDMDAKVDYEMWFEMMDRANLDVSILENAEKMETNEDGFRALVQGFEDYGSFDWEVGENVEWLLKNFGFDGITHVGGGRYGSKDGTNHVVAIAFDPEQIKNVENKNPTSNPDIRFSTSSEDRARQKAERDLARSIGEIMSLPRKAVQQLQTGLVRDIMEEYQLTGELNTEKLEEAAANAFAQGLIIDNEYYEQYKHIRDQLRTTAVTISQQDQADITDYNQFRKRAFGTLRIVKQGGIPVDSLYQELMETTPELFPRTITHPADQLVHMYEVAREIRRVETPLERAMGEQSDQFYEWAEGKIAQTVERILTRYADSVTWKQQKAPTRRTAVLADDTPDTYDRANERMYDYGQQSYNELPEPGSGVVQEDYIQPEEGGIVWAGQSRVGNWRQEMPEYEADTYDRANEKMFRAGQERIGGYDPSYPEYQPDTYDPRTQERMERFGQEIIDDYEPMPEEPEALTEEEQARRGTMREWIQYVLSDKLTPEQFAERMRNSAVGELKGGAAKLVGRMEETARRRQGDGVNLYRDPDMTDEQYEALNAAWKNRKQRKIEKLETAEQIIIPKEAFRSTPAMDKLGIKIDGSVTRYRETAQLRAYDEAAEKAQKMLNRRIRKLNASAEEMDLAKMLVKGTITPAMLDREALNLNTITELADYLGAVESFNDDRINQRRAEINTNNLKVAKELLQDSEAYHPQLPGVLAGMTKLVMNERTPERVVKQIFGTEQGGKIYETYFRPVWVNGAEMHRFENRMLKRVAEFKDQDGRTRKLTEKEREFAQRLMEGEAAKESVMRLDQDLRERVISVAQNTNNGADFDDQTKEFGIDGEENERYRGLAQAYADYLDTVTLSGDMDQTILWNAIRTYQQIYNEMYEAMNDFLVSHGYKPMGFIKGYAPHFQKREVQQGLFGALKALGVEKESVTELPASIAGRTADFKPNMKWNPHMQSRQGTDTSYDIQMGFEQYLHYAAEMFYHTDDVMRIRQAVNWMRGQYSGEEISDAIKDAEVDQFKSVEWKHDFLLRKEFIKPQDDLDARAIQQAYQEYVTGLFERVKPENLRKYSEFVTWLDNYANIVAGKQSLADRGLEYGGGRNALNMGSKLMRRFASANVAGNISSVLNQSAQMPLLQQQLGTYLERAVFDLARGGARKENFAERSDFLTDKRGVDKLTTDNMEKFISGLFKPAEMMDRLVSTLAVRGRYLQALDQGMTPDEALKAADDFGRRVMGSRMKGARPLGFESKSFVNQMLHIFQTEASNTFDYMHLSDIPQAAKEVRKTKGKAAAARYTAGAIVGYLINAFLLNSLTDELYGGSPAPFDLMGWLLNFVAGGWGRDDEEFVKTVIDNAWEQAYGERPFETEQLDREEGFRWAGAVDDLGYDVLGDVPYVRNALGVMGLGDQSMPTVGINDFAESVRSAGKTLVDQITKGKEETGLDWAGAAAKIGEDLLDAATLVLPGGRQIQKSYQGIKGVAMGGKVSGFGENARLQYPIEQNAWNAIRAGLFGLTALDETDAFYAGGQALTAGQTQKVRELEDKGIDQNITYELYQEFRQINKDLEGSEASEAKRNAINNLPLEDQQKLTVFDTFMLSKSSKNYEKTLSEYQAMLDAGLSWSEVTDAHNTYAMLDADEEMRGTEKATEFAKWVDLQGWNDEQRGAVEARFRFWNMMPAEATNYTKFEAAGLNPEQAATATELLAALRPEEGKETVSVNQKVAALQDSKLPADEKMDAIAALVPDRQARFVEAGVPDETAKTLAAEIAIAEAENGDDEVTYLEKARIAVDRTPNDEDALAAMSVVLNDSTYAKVEVIREYGVRCENWVSFREEWLDRYGDDSMSQEKVEAVLDRMNLDNRQKAALWQISNKSWKPDNNPYDAYVAEMVWDALN